MIDKNEGKDCKNNCDFLSNSFWDKRVYSKYKFWILGLILIFSFVLRILYLGFDSMWIDESISVAAAMGIIENGYPVLESGAVYARAEIFHYLMAFFIWVFGGDFGARFVSVLFGVFTVYLGYVFGRKFIDNNKNDSYFGGLCFAFLLCVSSIEIMYSKQARFYQMFQFFYFLSFYLFYKIVILRENIFGIGHGHSLYSFGGLTKSNDRRVENRENRVKRVDKIEWGKEIGENVNLTKKKSKIKIRNKIAFSGGLDFFVLFLCVYMTVHLQLMGFILLPLFGFVYFIDAVFSRKYRRNANRRVRFYKDKVLLFLGFFGLVFAGYVFYRMQGMLSLDYFERSFYYANLYSVFSWEYFPLMILSLLGFVWAFFRNWRFHLSFLSFVLIPFIGMFFVKLFATRYIYFSSFLLFFYLAYLISKMRFRVIFMVLLFVFYSGYVFDFNGVERSNYDFSMPVSDYKEAYEFVLADDDLKDLPLVSTWTPASVWYGNGADYWINYSISGGSNSWIVYNVTGREKFANAVILNSVNDIEIEMNSSDFVVVLDLQARNKMKPSWISFFDESCVVVFEGYQIEVFLCDLE